ncbi:hypothetical protein RFI_36425 [Reticulomyxa filosa]|uniref:Uncharacterized protein n=1 Tax=Reticulomyxa filosa TaxID=46433 RepID=X6LI35_RETFI|nr:hypothetical protein RFI_36425 [Reticulomyxa filosa]|eukprot:ETO01016.1 hypothetical protein RFI_36425 [Reticulomyxa filosa]
MKKHLQGQFLQRLTLLFGSPDGREPQYVKIILHAIYGRFMALRKAIRKHLCNYCYKYIYESIQDKETWQGLPEILEIFCSIFQGLNVPVKADYRLLIKNVIIPLHKTFHLDEFHDQLVACCTQFAMKDIQSVPVILGGILKYWPKFNPGKEQMFIQEIVHIITICSRDPKFITLPDFIAIIVSCFSLYMCTYIYIYIYVNTYFVHFLPPFLTTNKQHTMKIISIKASNFGPISSMHEIIASSSGRACFVGMA